MLSSHGMRIVVLLAAVALSACHHTSEYEEPTVDSLPYTPPPAQTATAHLIGDLRVATGAAVALELTGVVDVMGAGSSASRPAHGHSKATVLSPSL